MENVNLKNLKEWMPKPKIGLLPTGHFYYWKQFPKLRAMGLAMYEKLRKHLKIIVPGHTQSIYPFYFFVLICYHH